MAQMHKNLQQACNFKMASCPFSPSCIYTPRFERYGQVLMWAVALLNEWRHSFVTTLLRHDIVRHTSIVSVTHTHLNCFEKEMYEWHKEIYEWHCWIRYNHVWVAQNVWVTWLEKCMSHTKMMTHKCVSSTYVWVTLVNCSQKCASSQLTRQNCDPQFTTHKRNLCSILSCVLWIEFWTEWSMSCQLSALSRELCVTKSELWIVRH